MKHFLMTVLLITALCLIVSGCSDELVKDNPSVTSSGNISEIIVRGANMETDVNTTPLSDVAEPIVFTGDDILWFNETTREIRFKSSVANDRNPIISNHQTLRFYFGDEYLFSSLIYVNSISSQVFNSLVFYYSILENKYFLLDGYPPDTSVFQDTQNANQSRDDNRKQIESQWTIFIDQLKKEGKYQK